MDIGSKIKKAMLLASIGVVFGLATATREVNFFYPFLVMAWFIIAMKKKLNLSERLRSVLVILIFMGLTLTPFIWRNVKNLGVWYPISSAEGASYPVVEVYLKGENPELIKAGIDISRPNLLLQFAAKRPFFFGRILSSSLWNKFKHIYFNQGYGGFDMLFLRRMSNYYYALWFYVYVITIAGLFLAFKRYGTGLHSLVFLFIAYRTMVHLVTECSYRHRAPIEPFLLLYLSFGIYMLMFNRKAEDAE